MDTPELVSLDPNFKEFIELLNSERVEYLLLGGYAVNYYGYHRFTGDIDFWIAPTPENAKLVARALGKFGFAEPAFDPGRFLIPGKVHMFGVPPVRIDILTGPSGVSFDECFARRVVGELDGVMVSVISLRDLKTNKLASGRDKDRTDLKMLPEE